MFQSKTKWKIIVKDLKALLKFSPNHSLKEIENKTSLAVVMRGLLDPNEFLEVQENAKIKAEEALEEFESDIELLLILIKRGNVGKPLLKNSIQLKVLRDHFEEFVSAKKRLEDLGGQS